MANPPISRVEFTPTSMIVVAGATKFTFPLAATGAAALSVPFANVDAMLAAIGKHIDDGLAAIGTKLDAAVASLASPAPAAAPAAPAAPASNPLWFMNQQLSPNKLITLPEGTEPGHLHIGPENTPIVFEGAGMRKTLLDGQGGLGSGHRLSYGKGIVHTMGPAVFRNIGFVNAGGADGVSDGETSVYPEGFLTAGQLLLQLCAFDGCENGVFAPPGGSTLVDYVLDRCVFGRNKNNGLADGRSHDTYVCSGTFRIMASIFVGNSVGNTIKTRSPRLDVSDSYIGRSNGRWLDCPGATVATSTRNTYVSLPGCASGNAMGFNDEGDNNVRPGEGAQFTSTDDTFYISRFSEVIWLAGATTRAEFIRPKVFWVGQPGSQPPSVTFTGEGQLVGANPFVFDSSNRVSAPPDAPPDPA